VTPTSRNLAHILVKTKALATKIYNQLQNGADFAKLAKKYSTDKSSAIQGGKLGVQPKSGLVKAFADPAFALKTGTISKPVHSQYGWHIIKALGPVVPESTSPFSKEKAAIKQQLKQAKESNATSAWQGKINAYYKNRVKYASSLYAPPKVTSTTPAPTSLTPTG
jgi:foldase protein PrsA